MPRKMRKAANDDYWQPGLRLAFGTVCALVAGGLGVVLALGHLLAG